MTMMDALSAGGLIYLVLVTIPVALLPQNSVITHPFILMPILRGIGLLNALWMLSQFFLSQKIYGVFGNAAMDACFLAILIPSQKTVGTIIYSAAIGASGSSTAMAALGISLGVNWMMKYKSKPYLEIPIVMGFLALGAQKFFDSNGRFDLWRRSMIYWMDQINPWIGSGPGSYFLYGPKIQMLQGNTPDKLFVWMHNDWLQVLFEYGIIGFVLISILFVKMVRAAHDKKEPWLVASILTYGFVATTQMPLRYFLMSLLGACLLRLSLYRLPL